MPAPNQFVWYKWFPAKALTSARWLTLTAEQEGIYRRLYDLAALAQPAEKRGFLYEHDKPLKLKALAIALRLERNQLARALRLFGKKGMMLRDEHGAWGFGNFAKHQHDSNLRPRKDGLGAAEKRRQTAQESAQNRPESARPDVQMQIQKQSTDVPPPTPPLTRGENNDAVGEAVPVDLQNQALAAIGYVPDDLAAWVDQYPPPWIPLALSITKERGRKPPSYFKSILERWRKQGGPDTAGSGKPTGPRPDGLLADGYILSEAKRIR